MPLTLATKWYLKTSFPTKRGFSIPHISFFAHFPLGIFLKNHHKPDHSMAEAPAEEEEQSEDRANTDAKEESPLIGIDFGRD